MTVLKYDPTCPLCGCDMEYDAEDDQYNCECGEYLDSHQIAQMHRKEINTPEERVLGKLGR